MATVTEIRNAIKTVIDAVADVGNVFTTRVLAIDDAGRLYRLMAHEDTDTGEEELRGWQIMLSSSRRLTISTDTDAVNNSWQLESFQSVSEKATTSLLNETDEVDFDARNELVIREFRSGNNETLAGVVANTALSDEEGAEVGLQLVDHDTVMYGGLTPCAYAVFSLQTVHYEDKT